MASINTEGSNVRDWSRLKSSPTSGSAYSLASGNQSGGGGTNTGKGIGGFLNKVGKFLTTPMSDRIYKEFAEPYLDRKKEEGIDVYGPGDENPQKLRGTGDNQVSKGPLSIDENFEPHEWAKYKSFEDLTAYSQKLHDQAAAFDARRRASADPTTDEGKSTLSFLDKYQVYKGGNPWVNTDEARREYEQGRQEYLAYNFKKQMEEKNMTDGYEVAESPLSNTAARALVESGQIPSTLSQSQIRSILSSPGRTSDYDLMLLRRMLI